MSATNTKNCLITPSFSLDFERCKLLVESVERYVAAGVKHYLVVDKQDVALFKQLTSHRVELLVVEDIVPWWLMRMPGSRRWWLSLKTLPVRNWILQQIVKLSMAQVLTEEGLIFIDSDVFFIRPWDPSALWQNGKFMLFREQNTKLVTSMNDVWQNQAARLLGLPPSTHYDTSYVGNLISWRRSHVHQLYQQLEKTAHKSWVVTVAQSQRFSEYMLYGHFIERMLADSSGHWNSDTINSLCYWPTQPLDVAGLEDLKTQLKSEHVSVMISAKSHTPVPLIRQIFCVDL